MEVYFKSGQWWVEDLQSSNGIFLDGQRVTKTAVGAMKNVRLGIAGPIVSFAEIKPIEPEPPAASVVGDRTMVHRYVERYFSKANAEPVSEHTQFMRRAAALVQARERRKYQLLVALLAVIVLGAGTYAWRIHHQLQQQRSSAEDLFYNMKSLDLDIGNLQNIVQASSYQGPGLAEIQKYREPACRPGKKLRPLPGHSQGL